MEVDRFRNVLGEMQSKNNIVSINADEALQRLYSIQGAKIPQELDIKSFMNTLDSIVNKDNFIAHLQKKNDSQNRLAYLNLVEPTLNKWDLKLTSGDRTDLIKVFNDGKNFFTLLITAENNKRLITFLPKAREDYIANKIKNADHIQTFISRASKENEWTRNANPTTKQEISKEIESKSTQEKEKKERMHRGVYSVYYDDIMIDFRKKYDPDDDLWFMKHAKLEYSDNGEEVYAALKNWHEVRDNVSTTYDDYVAATEQVKNSLNRAALDIIDDFKATDEAFEAIEKIQTKLLDDYPFNQKRDTIQKENGITPHTKDTHAKPNTRDTKETGNTKTHYTENTNTTHYTEKENSHTDNKHEATQRESGADTEWITTRTSNNPQENKDTETTLKRDNGISDEYSPSTKEMAQSGNEKANEKGNLRDDSSHSSSDIEANANISRDTQGHNARIRLDETDNKRYKHDGNDDRDNSRTRIHRNVSLKKKGSVKKDTQTETTQEIPQNKIKEYSDEYENNLFALRAEQKKDTCRERKTRKWASTIRNTYKHTDK